MFFLLTLERHLTRLFIFHSGGSISSTLIGPSNSSLGHNRQLISKLMLNANDV